MIFTVTWTTIITRHASSMGMTTELVWEMGFYTAMTRYN